MTHAQREHGLWEAMLRTLRSVLVSLYLHNISLTLDIAGYLRFLSKENIDAYFENKLNTL